MRRSAGNYWCRCSFRLVGVLVAVILASVGCRSGEETATPATLVEAGTSTSEHASPGTVAAAPTGSTTESDHPAMTVEVDGEQDATSATTAAATSVDPADSVATKGSGGGSQTESDSDPSNTGSGSDPQTVVSSTGSDTNATASTEASGSDSDSPARFTTLGPGAELPTGDQCASWVRATGDGTESRPDNTAANASVPTASVTDGLIIDGADTARNQRLAPRIDGDFTGTTEQILRWGACKWGFDEDMTRARAVAESSWRMSTTGDRTEDAGLCARIGLSAPCPQSYGLLQVKGTVHEGTYPTSVRATAFGVDYAMAWLRACFEGGFGWLEGTGDGRGYGAGDELGCVGAWFSGRWWDQAANDYVGKVRQHLDQRTWESYR